MTYWLVNWSVKFRRIVIAVASGLLVFGFLQLHNLKQDILPEFSPTIVEVQTEALGLSAAEVERLITTPLEQDLLNGVAFLDTIESASLPGLSSVVMTFESGTDLLDARQVVAERLTQAAGLPQVADPPQMIQPLSSTSRVAMVSLASTDLTPIEVSVLARWVIVPRLLGVEGVAHVSIWGFRDRQLQVLVDPANLAEHNVTLSQIIRTTGNALEVSPLSFVEASSPGTGGFIDTVNQRLHVFHEQAISTPEQLASVSIENQEGGAVFVAGEALPLGSVAEIVTDHQPLIGDALCIGGPCVLLVIEKFPDSNTPEVASGVDEALDALSLGLTGMNIDRSIYQPAAFIDVSIDNLRGRLIIGAALLLVLLGAFLFNWRIALVSVASIASSLAAAGIVLLVLDVTVNAMILAGLVMALIVILDDAVAAAWDIAESAGGQDAESARVIPAIVDSVLRLRSVATYTAAISAAVLLPVVAMTGAAGAFLEPIALTYFLAIAVALVVSSTVAPALGVLLLANAQRNWPESRMSVRMRGWITSISARLVPKTSRALAVFGVLVLAGLVAIPTLSRSLEPSLDERDVLVQLEAAAGTSLPRMDELTAQMAADLRSLPVVDSSGAHVGRAIASDQIVNVNSAEIWLNIDSSVDYATALKDIESVVDGYTEVVGHVQTYSSQRISAILDRPVDEIVVRVYGQNPDIRQNIAEQVSAIMVGVDGIQNPRIDTTIEEPTIEIEVDLETAQAFGVKPGDVRRQAATLLSGIVVGNLFEDQKVFDVVVWGVPEIRETIDDVRSLLIATPSGDQVPLENLADVRVVPNPIVIRHESVSSYIDVSARTQGRGLAAAAADVDERLGELRFPLEHHVEVLGGFAQERAAQNRVVAAAVAAVIGIYLLLQAAFTSWRLATLAFLGLPMALSGSLILISLTGGDVTLGSVAGMVAVFGLATRGVIMMFRAYQARERSGEAFGEDLVIAANRQLIIPSLISTAAVAAVFLPLLIAGSGAGLELATPIALALLGGLITTNLLILVVMPAFYLKWGYVASPDMSGQDLFTTEIPVSASSGD